MSSAKPKSRRPYTGAPRNAVRHPRTMVQRARAALLVLLDVTQADLAKETGVSPGSVYNLLLDKNRSFDGEEKIIQYLDARYPELEVQERLALRSLGFEGGVTREAMGWPLPKPRESPLVTDGSLDIGYGRNPVGGVEPQHSG